MRLCGAVERSISISRKKRIKYKISNFEVIQSSTRLSTVEWINTRRVEGTRAAGAKEKSTFRSNFQSHNKKTRFLCRKYSMNLSTFFE